MLSAEVGLVAVPHVVAPAGPDELARGVVARTIPEVADRPILFVPGVRTPPADGPDGWAEADVMRGEECETLGALRLLFPPSPDPDPPSPTRAFVWPGSHTKLVEVDGQGRIVRSHTTLAGELTRAVARHTLLAASLPEALPDGPDPEALEAGARLVGREGLGRAAFLVRVAALSGALDPLRRASFWVGAVVADDVAHLARHPDPAREAVPGLGRGAAAAAVALRPVARRAPRGAGRRARRRRRREGRRGRRGDGRPPPPGTGRARRPGGPPHDSPNRLHDQTTWPMIRPWRRLSPISMGIRGCSRLG